MIAVISLHEAEDNLRERLAGTVRCKWVHRPQKPKSVANFACCELVTGIMFITSMIISCIIGNRVAVVAVQLL